MTAHFPESIDEINQKNTNAISIDEIKLSLKLVHVVDQLVEFGVCRDVCSLIVQYARPFVISDILRSRSASAPRMRVVENEDDVLKYDDARGTILFQFPKLMKCGRDVSPVNTYFYEAKVLHCSIGIVDCIPTGAQCNFMCSITHPDLYQPVGGKYSKYVVELKLVGNASKYECKL